MKFSQIAEQAKKEHQQLLVADRKDRKAVESLDDIVFYIISHLIGDIRRFAKSESGPRRKLWHNIIRDLDKMATAATSFRREQDSTRFFASVDQDYDSIIKAIRELEY